jgi:alkanesulfonate monooxygenase
MIYYARVNPNYLWYVPNDAQPGHRGDTTTDGWGSLDYSTDLAQRCERSGWGGALIGTGWGQPDTMTLATALAARTATFRPLVAARPGYWQPAQFAAAAATLDSLSGGRLMVNVVTGQDNPAAYGDPQGDQPTRYARTGEFIQLVRRLWTEEDVTFEGEHYRVAGATLVPRPHLDGDRRHPPLYFGGASEAAERTAAAHADVQLFWGEPLDGIAERIDRLRGLEREHDREKPLEFGLRITTVVRATADEAWRHAEAKTETFAKSGQDWLSGWHTGAAVGQRRLLDLHQRGDVLAPACTPAPRPSAVVARPPPGSSGRRRTSPRRWRRTTGSASPTSSSPTRPTDRRRSGSAARCCLGSAS